MLKKTVWAIFLLCLSAAVAVAQEAPSFEAGVHYEVLPTAVPTSDPEKIEVVAVFAYSCPHCATLEPTLQSWAGQLEDDVYFTHLPAVFSRNWEPLARAYYVAELSGKLNEAHLPMFDAIHVQNNRFRSTDDIAAFYANYGIEKDEFMKLYNSFAVDTRIKQGQARLRGYQITAVPAMVVNGKYHITGAMAGSNNAMLRVANYLIEKERAALAN
ncbi:MAG: thiol:disulfide interchange protein DsbA/DsbL [Oceanospirillales bacterium]|jgi:thiol:disulfide interchange protein DsbA|nr:MAG: thiol:disulfide interchange protein DsbA/DsbL [Oceanospirillales bacterium]